MLIENISWQQTRGIFDLREPIANNNSTSVSFKKNCHFSELSFQFLPFIINLLLFTKPKTVIFIGLHSCHLHFQYALFAIIVIRR